MDVNDYAYIQDARGALETIASKPQAGARSYRVALDADQYNAANNLRR